MASGAIGSQRDYLTDASERELRWLGESSVTFLLFSIVRIHYSLFFLDRHRSIFGSNCSNISTWNSGANFIMAAKRKTRKTTPPRGRKFVTKKKAPSSKSLVVITKKVAAKAAKTLRNPKSTKAQKSAAASALGKRVVKSPPKRGFISATAAKRTVKKFR